MHARHNVYNFTSCRYPSMHACQVTAEDGKKHRLFIVLAGVKGDWVYLRTLVLWVLQCWVGFCLFGMLAHSVKLRQMSPTWVGVYLEKEVSLLQFAWALPKLFWKCMIAFWSCCMWPLWHVPVNPLIAKPRSGTTWSGRLPGSRKGHGLQQWNSLRLPCTPYRGVGHVTAPLTKCIHGITVWEESFALPPLYLDSLQHAMHAWCMWLQV